MAAITQSSADVLNASLMSIPESDPPLVDIHRTDDDHHRSPLATHDDHRGFGHGGAKRVAMPDESQAWSFFEGRQAGNAASTSVNYYAGGATSTTHPWHASLAVSCQADLLTPPQGPAEPFRFGLGLRQPPPPPKAEGGRILDMQQLSDIAALPPLPPPLMMPGTATSARPAKVNADDWSLDDSDSEDEQ